VAHHPLFRRRGARAAGENNGDQSFTHGRPLALSSRVARIGSRISRESARAPAKFRGRGARANP
jgi:hypothetical protein